MSFFVESGGKEFKLTPAGTHLARCYRIIDLGTQQSEYMGQMKFLRKVMLGWEIHGEEEDGTPLTTDDGAPLAIFKNYTLSWSENANLRKDLQGWRGQPWTDAEANRFDLKNILGQWCMLNVIHRPGENGKTYANVAGIAPVPAMIKKAGLPEGMNELQVFRLAEPDWEMFETFSKGLKTKIEASPEFKALTGRKAPPAKQVAPEKQAPASGFDDMDDDVPF
jgi:hypothetical protein